MTEGRLLGLHWGIKSSFLGYVARMPDGRASFTDGATATEGNITVFDHDPSTEQPSPEGPDSFFAFRGDVRFGGHAGMMFVRIADPWITVVGDRAQMTVLDPQDRDAGSRLPLVNLTLEPRSTDEPIRIWLATDVALTPEGVGLFNDVYPAGEPLAPLAIFLPRERA